MTEEEKRKNDNTEVSKEDKEQPQGNAQETKAEESRDPRAKTRLRVSIINVLTFIIVMGGFVWLVKSYFHFGESNFTNAAQVEEFVNPINTRVGAYIKEIRFIEHQPVKKGDTLIILDNREILTQVAQAEAAYMNALASKNVTASTVNTVTNNISVSNANIAGAKAKLENAAKNLERYQNLIQSEAVTRSQYDQVKTEYDVAKSSYDALINQKETANLTATEAKTKLELNDAEIKRTLAALEMATLNLSYTVITAPYDGIMGRRLINEGQLLQQSQQVATIVLDDNKWVTANFLESQLPKINVGEKLTLTIDAVGNKKFEGVVTAISAATGARYSNVPVDNSSGNFVKVQQRIPVRIEFTDENDKEDIQKLKAGMNVSVYLQN